MSNNQPLNSIYKLLSIEVALIYIEFHKTVLNEKGTITAVSNKLRLIGIHRNQTAIKRILKELRDLINEQCDVFIYVRNINKEYVPDGKYSELLYKMCEEIARAAISWKNNADNLLLTNPEVKVAAIGFSFPYLELLRRKIKADSSYKKSFSFDITDCRSKDVPNILENNLSLSFALGESAYDEIKRYKDDLAHDPIVPDYPDLESRVIGEEELYLISNERVDVLDGVEITTLDNSRTDTDNQNNKLIKKCFLKHIPYITTQNSVLQRYIALETGLIERETHFSPLDIMSILKDSSSGIDIREVVEPTLTAMIDALILSSKLWAIIGGTNLVHQISSRKEYLEKFFGENSDIDIKKAHPYHIEGRPFIQRRLYRNRRDAFRLSRESLQTKIWLAADEMHNEIYNDETKLSCAAIQK